MQPYIIWPSDRRKMLWDIIINFGLIAGYVYHPYLIGTDMQAPNDT
jgi:hypothetical protein